MVDLLGAHVSTAGGISNAPTRGAEVGATAIQVFTKSPNQWKERTFDKEEVARFKKDLARTKSWAGESLGGFVAEWGFARALAIYMPRDTIW